MPNDFKLRKAQEALKEQNPHAADAKFASLTLVDCAKTSVLYGITAGCFAGCAAIVGEIGDHGLGLLCYAGCSFVGAAVTYSAFRKSWQVFSMPAKEALLDFVKPKK
jgi:hypothetical protein